MKYHSLSFLLILLLCSGGCALMRSSYQETREYDLSGVEVKAATALPPVKLGVFRNLSGAGLQFLVRSEGNVVQTDVYNRWLMSPERLVEREFYRVLVADNPAENNQRDYLLLSGTILKFEFDRAADKAVLELDLTARVFRDGAAAGSHSACAVFETRSSAIPPRRGWRQWRKRRQSGGICNLAP